MDKPRYRWMKFMGAWAWWHVGDYERLWSPDDFNLSFRYLEPLRPTGDVL